jgi:hypothetical protein
MLTLEEIFEFCDLTDVVDTKLTDEQRVRLAVLKTRNNRTLDALLNIPEEYDELDY